MGTKFLFSRTPRFCASKPGGAGARGDDQVARQPAAGRDDHTAMVIAIDGAGITAASPLHGADAADVGDRDDVPARPRRADVFTAPRFEPRRAARTTVAERRRTLRPRRHWCTAADDAGPWRCGRAADDRPRRIEGDVRGRRPSSRRPILRRRRGWSEQPVPIVAHLDPSPEIDPWITAGSGAAPQAPPLIEQVLIRRLARLR